MDKNFNISISKYIQQNIDFCKLQELVFKMF